MIYLAVDYGYDGWSLKEYATVSEALEAVKTGIYIYDKWKILKELEIMVNED